MSGKLWLCDKHCHYTRDALPQYIDRRTDETRCESGDTYLLGAGGSCLGLGYERDQAS